MNVFTKIVDICKGSLFSIEFAKETKAHAIEVVPKHLFA